MAATTPYQVAYSMYVVCNIVPGSIQLTLYGIGWSFNQSVAWNRAHFGGWCISSAPLILGTAAHPWYSYLQPAPHRKSAAATNHRLVVWRCAQGMDLVKGLSDELVEIITNEEAIAINQQWVGHPGTLLRNISSNGNGAQLWHKPQPNSTIAVLVINSQSSTISTNITLAELNMTSSSCTIRNVWQRKDMGQATNAVSIEVAPLDSQFLLLSPLAG